MSDVEAGSVDVVRLPALDGTGRAVLRYAGRVLAVFAHAGSVAVLDGTCPHRGGPLAEGLVRDGAVVCPWHWYAFDLATGECRNAEHEGAATYEVVDVDGVPHVRVPAREELSWSERLRRHARDEG